MRDRKFKFRHFDKFLWISLCMIFWVMNWCKTLFARWLWRFLHYCLFVRESYLSPLDSPHKIPVMRSFEDNFGDSKQTVEQSVQLSVISDVMWGHNVVKLLAFDIMTQPCHVMKQPFQTYHRYSNVVITNQWLCWNMRIWISGWFNLENHFPIINVEAWMLDDWRIGNIPTSNLVIHIITGILTIDWSYSIDTWCKDSLSQLGKALYINVWDTSYMIPVNKVMILSQP